MEASLTVEASTDNLTFFKLNKYQQEILLFHLSEEYSINK